jgi:cation diffusion facilitator family transporter
MNPGNRRAVITALGANLGVATGKLMVFSATGSASMLAESVHSLADSTNQALLLFGGRSAQRPPTPEHPFGYGRERFFWAFVVALVIFSLGGLFAIYEGTSKFFDPHPLTRPWLAIGLLVFAAALEGFALSTAVREARKERGNASWLAFIRRTKNPELPVILLEDLGALLGLLFAGLGIGLAMYTGDARFDALGSVVIGILLCSIAILLAVEMRSLLIGEAASPARRQAIHAAIESSEGVSRLIHMRTQHLGPEELLIAAKVEFVEEQSVSELAKAIDRVEARIRKVAPISLIYLEPDLYRPSAEAPADDPSSSARPSRSSGTDNPS